MVTLEQWRASIGQFSLRTGSSKWRTSRASRTRSKKKENIESLGRIKASADIITDANRLWIKMGLFLFSIFGLRYVAPGVDAFCGVLFKITCVIAGKVSSVSQRFVICTNLILDILIWIGETAKSTDLRIFIPYGKRRSIISLKRMLLSVSKIIVFIVTQLSHMLISGTLFFMKKFAALFVLICCLAMLSSRFLFQTKKAMMKLVKKHKCILLILIYIGVCYNTIWKDISETGPSHHLKMVEPKSSGFFGLAAGVIQLCLMMSGDVEANPGPADNPEKSTQGKCKFCSNFVGFSKFQNPTVAMSADAKYLDDTFIWKNTSFGLGAGQKEGCLEDALTRFAKREYGDVMDGTAKLTVVPDSFVPRSGNIIYGWPELFKEYGLDKNSKISTDYKGDDAELFVLTQLIKIFQNKKACILHSHKGIKNLENIDIKINEIEVKIKKEISAIFKSEKTCFKIDEIASKLDDLKKSYEHEKETTKKAELSKFIKTLNDALDLSKFVSPSENINLLDLLKATRLRKQIYANSEEIDFITILPERKTVFVFEIKSAENVKTTITKAQKQINASKEYLSKFYGKNLENWNFCGAIIFPNAEKISDKDKKKLGICDICDNFILTKPLKDNPTPIELKPWFEKILEPTELFTPESYESSYVSLFKRLVGFRSMCPLSHRQGTMEVNKAITGKTQAIHISTSSPNDPCHEPEKSMDPKDLKNMPLGSSSYVLFFNKLQLTLFNIKRLFLMADYGTGKSTLLYSAARRLQNLEIKKDVNEQKPIFIISMAATDRYNNNNPEPFDYIMDIALKEEFLYEPGITVISIPDLIESENDDNLNTLELLQKFMAKNKNSHFLVDEMAIRQRQLFFKDHQNNKILENCTKLLSNDAVLWIAGRSNSLCDNITVDSKEDKVDLEIFRELLTQIGFTVQELQFNMRNTASIAEIEPAHVRTGRVTTSVKYIQPAQVPKITLNGKMPKCITGVRKKDVCPAVEHVIRNILRLDMSNPETSLVILCQAQSDIPDIDKYLRSREFIKQPIFTYNPSKDGKTFDSDYQIIKEFLNRRGGILLTKDLIFTGVESETILLILSEGLEYQRNACFRSVAELVVISRTENIFPTTLTNVVEKDQTFNMQRDFVEFCYEGNIGEVDEDLDKNKININAVSNIMTGSGVVRLYTPLMAAVHEGNLEVAEKLLLHPQININERGDDLETAFMVAAELGKKDCTELLLSQPNLETNIVDILGETALDKAIKSKHKSTVEMIYKLEEKAAKIMVIGKSFDIFKDRLGESPILKYSNTKIPDYVKQCNFYEEKSFMTFFPSHKEYVEGRLAMLSIPVVPNCLMFTQETKPGHNVVEPNSVVSRIVTHLQEVRCFRLAFDKNSFNIGILDEKFIKAVEKLPDPKNVDFNKLQFNETLESFTEKFHLYFVTEIFTGGSRVTQFLLKANEMTEDKLNQKQTEIETMISNPATEELLTHQIGVKLSGGGDDIVANYPHNIPQDDIDRWKTLTFKSPTPLTTEMSLLPTHMAVSLVDKAKGEMMKKFTELALETGVRWGTKNYDSGHVYNGQLLSNSRHGSGEWVHKDGDKYRGECQNGRYEGVGEYRWTSGEVYIGEYSAGKRHGAGVAMFPSGDVYVGEYRENVREGHATYYFHDGRVFVGEYRQKKRDGAGIEYSSDGTREQGSWRNGEQDGEFTVIKQDGTTSQVMYRDGKRI